MKKKIIVTGIILALVIIVGMAITAILGLNYSLLYSAHQEIEIPLEKEFENKDIQDIVKEVIGNQTIVIQKVELYEDMVSIHVKEITEEQLENLNAKINEKYETTNETKDLVVTSIPKVRGRDLIKPYLLPVSISFLLIIVYFIIYIVVKNHIGKNINIIKTLGILIGMILGVQLFYLAVLAITRLPINTLTIPIAILLYVVTTMGMIVYLEKQN